MDHPDNHLTNPKVRHLRYEPLRKRLMEIPYWPHRYRHKIIGKNNAVFENSVGDLQSKFPNLTRELLSESKNGTYISVTFELIADDADQIIELWVESELVKDCVKIL